MSSIETKIAALLSHESQFVTTHGIFDGDDGTARTVFAERVREHAAAVGERSDVPAGEIFKLLQDL